MATALMALGFLAPSYDVGEDVKYRILKNGPFIYDDLREVLSKLRTPSAGWKPMSWAPRTGTQILWLAPNTNREPKAAQPRMIAGESESESWKELDYEGDVLELLPETLEGYFLELPPFPHDAKGTDDE